MKPRSSTIAPRARQHLRKAPRGAYKQLVEDYHRHRLRHEANGMQAIETLAVLDGHFRHVQLFLDYYRDCEWSGWLAGVDA